MDLLHHGFFLSRDLHPHPPPRKSCDQFRSELRENGRYPFLTAHNSPRKPHIHPRDRTTRCLQQVQTPHGHSHHALLLCRDLHRNPPSRWVRDRVRVLCRSGERQGKWSHTKLTPHLPMATTTTHAKFREILSSGTTERPPSRNPPGIFRTHSRRTQK